MLNPASRKDCVCVKTVLRADGLVIFLVHDRRKDPEMTQAAASAVERILVLRRMVVPLLIQPKLWREEGSIVQISELARISLPRVDSI